MFASNDLYPSAEVNAAKIYRQSSFAGLLALTASVAAVSGISAEEQPTIRRMKQLDRVAQLLEPSHRLHDRAVARRAGLPSARALTCALTLTAPV